MSRRRTAAAALALLREWSWLRALLGVIAISVVFVLLGRWQYHRHETKSAQNALVNHNYAAAPVPLLTVLPDPTRPLPATLKWRTVRERGHYQLDHTMLARNRPFDTGDGNPNPGYEVLVPFATDSGPVLLIDRGWIPAGSDSGAAPDSVPPAPSGTVQITARLKPTEPHSSRGAPAGQTQRIDLPELSRTFGEQLVGGYGVLATESPRPTVSPTLLPRPDDSTLGINLAYAVQWVLFAIAAYVMLAVGAVREVRRRQAGAAAGDASAARPFDEAITPG